jgi:serine protease Do
MGVALAEILDERAKELGMSEPYGVEVTNVAPASPAEKAGLSRGDVILEYHGQKVLGIEHIVRLVRETPVGRRVTLKLLRKGTPAEARVEMGRRKGLDFGRAFFCGDDDEDCQFRMPNFSIDFDIPRPRIVMQNRILGGEIEQIDGQLADYFGVEGGLLVREVNPNSRAARAGLKAGDVIVSVDGKPVREPGEIREALHASQGTGPVPMEVVRNKAKQSLRLEPGQKRSERIGKRFIYGPRGAEQF